MKFRKEDNVKIKEMSLNGIPKKDIVYYIINNYGLSSTRAYEIVKNNTNINNLYSGVILECLNILIDRMYNSSSDRIKLDAMIELNKCLLLSHKMINKKPSNIKSNKDVIKSNSYYLDKLSNGDLYFIIDNDKLKIGKTKRLEGRIKELKRSYPNMVVFKVLKGCDKYEPILHNIFSEYNIILDKNLTGHTEWFVYNNTIMEFISDIDEFNIDLKVKSILNKE